jgi:hypothetical protein
MKTWINKLHPSLWKYIDRLFKIYDKKDNITNTLIYMIKNYNNYMYKEYIYKDYNNLFPIYYITDKEDINKDYIFNIINLLCINENIKDKVGWLDTNNNIICFIDKNTAFNFYKYFGFN